MPDTSHPPYNVVQPRILNRWLDINSQNGPLQRCATVIDIPEFHIPAGLSEINIGEHFWLGYSQLRGYFQFTAPNKFSIKHLPSININCLLCISWTSPNEVPLRYRLNSDVGELLYFDCPLYTNQRIEKSFRIEVWDTDQNTDQNDLINNSAIELITTVLQAIDYRYGIDSALSIAEPVNLNIYTYHDELDLFDIPLTFNQI